MKNTIIFLILQILSIHSGLFGQDMAQTNQLKNIFFGLPVGKSATQVQQAIQSHSSIIKDSNCTVEEGEFRGSTTLSTKSIQANSYELSFDNLGDTYTLELYAIYDSKPIIMAKTQYQHLIDQFRKISPKTQPYKHPERIGFRFFDSVNAVQPYLTIYMGSRSCVPEFVIAIEYEHF